jgi:hypothetical protein
MPTAILVAATLLFATLPVTAQALTEQERIDLIRGLTAEYATAKTLLPRSKKALTVDTDGHFDKRAWEQLAREYGPAARAGELVQITKLSLEDDRIELEINGGWKGGRKWYEGVQVGIGSRTTPVVSGSPLIAPGGTKLQLMFAKKMPGLKVAQVKEMLAGILDFNMHSASEQYLETVPPEIKTAIEEKRAMEGMDKDQVLLALGHPRNKVREIKDGVEVEDWIYGVPPGRIIFVTFQNNKVIRVKESYAELGGEVAAPLPTPR